MKKIKGLIVGIITATSVVAYSEYSNQITAVYDNIKVIINGTEMPMLTEGGETIEPFMVDYSVYVPVRGLSQALDKNVSWDSENKAVIVSDAKKRNIGSVSFLGDSITRGLQLDDERWAYPYTLAEKMGVDQINNYSITGTAISRDNEMGQAFINRYKEIDNTSDMIIVMGGTNDISRGVPIGDPDDTSTETVYGAVKNLMYGLKFYYPNAIIVFCTMPKRDKAQDYGEKVSNCIIETGAIFDIPVIDLFHAEECDLTRDNNKYYIDGVHPNRAGHDIISQYIYNQLRERGLI